MQALAPQFQPLINAYKVAYDKRLKESGATQSTVPSYIGLPEITVTAPSTSTVDSRDLILPISARSVGSIPLKAIEVTVNGVSEPLVHIPTDPSGRKSFESRLSLVLSSGTNEIEVTAIDAQQRRSLTEERTITYSGKTSSTLYLVPVGISHYSDQRMDLGYADTDATALAQYFTSKSETNAATGKKSPFDKIVVTNAIINETMRRIWHCSTLRGVTFISHLPMTSSPRACMPATSTTRRESVSWARRLGLPARLCPGSSLARSAYLFVNKHSFLRASATRSQRSSHSFRRRWQNTPTSGTLGSGCCLLGGEA